MYSCTDLVQRIEQCQRGSLYMCSIVQGCKRTYLSQRDLQAHINHRHMRSGKSSSSRSDSLHLPPASEVSDRFRVPPPHLPKPHVLIPPLAHQGHDPYSQPPSASHDDLRPPQGQPPGDMGPSRSLAQETFRISTVTTRKHSNLITVPIQDDSASSGPSREPLPQPGNAPPPSPSPRRLSRSARCDPSASHDGTASAALRPPRRPLPPSVIPCRTQDRAQTHLTWFFNQAPPPLSSVPPPITPPPGHLIGQMPPFMNHPPPGPPPQHGGPLSMPRLPTITTPSFPRTRAHSAHRSTSQGAWVLECGRRPGSSSSNAGSPSTGTDAGAASPRSGPLQTVLPVITCFFLLLLNKVI